MPNRGPPPDLGGSRGADKESLGIGREEAVDGHRAPHRADPGMIMNESGIAGSASIPMAGVYRVSFDIASSEPSGFGVRVPTTQPNLKFGLCQRARRLCVSRRSVQWPHHGQARNLQLVNIQNRQMVVKAAL